MSTLRSIRLLNSVEAGITDGNALTTFLSDSGRLSEFSVLMSMRGQARRMASSSVTVDTFIDCPIVLNAIFADTDINNPMVAKAIFKKQTAMINITADRNTLSIIVVNPTSLALLVESQWFETYIKHIIADLTLTVDPDNFADVAALVTDNNAMTVIVESPEAMIALVASPSSTQLVAADLTIMGIVVDSAVAMGAFAESPTSMTILASELNAMNEIIASPTAMPIVASSPSAMAAISATNFAFNKFLSSTFFADNIKNAIANIIGVPQGDFADVNSMIDDADALAILAESTPAVKALASSSAAIAYLATSPNLSVILNSANAMAVIGTDANMTTLMGVEAAIPAIFASSTAKGIIITSTPLVDLIAPDGPLRTYALSLASAPTLPSALNVPGTSQPFAGIPNKVLVVAMRANNIGAIAAAYNFTGSPATGTGVGDPIALKGTVTESVNYGYTNPHWKVAGIAATAAVSPEWTYVDMT
jgi:hypothetical protein